MGVYFGKDAIFLVEETGQKPEQKQAAPADNGPALNAGIAMISPLCICHRCPTYPGEKDPKVYCARGASPKPIEMKGCICAKCPVQKMLMMKRTFYCYYGSNRARKKEESA
jgi:Protein of unknown function (DUF2769)